MPKSTLDMTNVPPDARKREIRTGAAAASYGVASGPAADDHYGVVSHHFKLRRNIDISRDGQRPFVEFDENRHRGAEALMRFTEF